MIGTSGIEQPLELPDGITRDYLVHHRVCPIGRDPSGRLRLAASADAALDDALEDLGFLYGLPVIPELLPSGEVERLIERLTARSAGTLVTPSSCPARSPCLGTNTPPMCATSLRSPRWCDTSICWCATPMTLVRAISTWKRLAVA